MPSQARHPRSAARPHARLGINRRYRLVHQPHGILFERRTPSRSMLAVAPFSGMRGQIGIQDLTETAAGRTTAPPRAFIRQGITPSPQEPLQFQRLPS